MSLRFFLKDTVEEVFSIDGKFVRTIRLLITRPGFLTNEVIAGRLVPYIKPIRLYSVIVVLHFLIFSFVKSADLFTIERFPFFKIIPGMQQLIATYHIKSGLTYEIFADTLNQNIKDNLNIIFYFMVFILAGYFKLMFFNSGKYYMEHLYYFLHVLSFGLIRNVVLIPLLALDQMILTAVISLVIQLIYGFISLKVVYRESVFRTSIKLILSLLVFVLTLIPSVVLALAIGIIQIMS